MQYKIKIENNQEVLCLYLDYNEEFAEEWLEKAKEGREQITQFIKEKGLNFKGHLVKIFVGSVLVGTMVVASGGGDQKVQAAEPSTHHQVYTVQSGDSLYKIAQRTGVSIDTLREVNRLSSDTIFPGQTLFLQEQVEIGHYNVQPGDSLYIIAQKYGMDVNELKDLNNLSTDTIYPGQTLRVVQKAGSNIDEQSLTYTVQAGDNLSTIAKRHGMTTQQLKALNELTSDLIHPGQELLVHSTDTREDNQIEATTYTVQVGDNLSSIAKRYGMTTRELMMLNGLTSDVIRPGDVLKVGGSITETNTYTVVSGDNLSTIAKRFGMTTQELKALNGLTSDVIRPGDVLKVQGEVDSNYETYTVKSGDNLWKIARQYGMTIPQLKKLNNLTSEVLQPGQVLRVEQQQNEQREVISTDTIMIRRSNGQIVTLNIEDYIVGVVSAEMPPYFHEEALKAQALTARTYAAHYTQKGRVLSDTDNHQVYYSESELRSMWGNQFDKYYQKVRNAVLETQGEVITYDGDLIEAYFFSTSNGRTEEPKYVWGGTVPYLQSVESPWDTRSVEFLDETTMSFSQFSSRLGLGTTTGLYAEVISYTPGGGVDRINIAGKVFNGETVRARLGLRSTDFELHFEGGQVRIVQRGWGHRIGMSQYGANYMAQDGYTYDQIIHHYYRGVTIEQL